jgi:hypothetical protein
MIMVAVHSYSGGERGAMTSDQVDPRLLENPELPVEELLCRGRPTSPRSETAIPDLTDEEWEAFMAAVKR